ncbi:MAG: FAD-binding oxidoreductase [Rhodanobacteraceae bacterium]
MNEPWQKTILTSFDRQTRLETRVQSAERYRQLEQLPDDCPRIARGGGVSYVAASFDREAVSQCMASFDRLLAFDAERGELHVQAGASIASVQRFALAHGWYLPVAPGHPRVSIGGCIAANVHGKNPARDGCFAAVTGALHLFHPRLGWREAERGDALWQATLGGFGLTGSIVSAHIALRPAPQRIRLEGRRVANLREAAAVLQEHAGADLVYGWHDGRPAHFGSGLIRIGHASREIGPGSMPRVRLPASYHAAPLPLWNLFSLAMANPMLVRRWRAAREVPLGEALLPLNDAGGYFAAYGRRGLLECQWLVPHDAFDSFAGKLEQLVRRRHALLPLISSKLFDGACDGPGFDGRGVSLALHMPANSDGLAFACALADLALDHQGRPNPIKQSGLDAASLRRALPDLEAWQAKVAAHNPGHLLQSELIRRLQLD